VDPKPILDSMLAAVVGLLLGVALAFLAETLDTRVRTVDEIRDALGLRILARIPEFRRQQAQMVMLQEPQSAQAEAFRTLRISLDLIKAQRELKTIMVASAQHEEGKSTTVANLAVALARAGRTVAVVDCDLHRPSLDRLFRIRTTRGLPDVLVGDASIERVLTRIAIGRPASGAEEPISNGSGSLSGVVEVLPSGQADVEEALVGEGIREVLQDLESRFDYVLVDTPPLLDFGDGLGVSAHVDGVLVLARIKRSKRGALTELRQILDGLPAEPIGIVATGTDVAARRYYSPEPQSKRHRDAQLERATTS
jgi:Mrp family chromosome partitioning ATPase